MKMNTRWVKIFKDMWDHKSRSVLVVLSIAVGVAAVGMINTAKTLIQRDLYGAYTTGNPALVQIYVSPFDEELAGAVQGMREVEMAEARRLVSASLSLSDGSSKDLGLTLVSDFDNIQINQLTLERGVASPGIREILFERQSAAALDIAIGDVVTVEMQSGRRYDLTVAGIVHDIYTRPYPLSKEASGYINMDTLQWMGEQPYYNRLDIVVAENKFDREHVLAVAGLARDRVIVPSGHVVARIQVPGFGSDPGQHWAQSQINGLLIVLQVMGILAIFLSGGLVVNTISAILTQQIKQIGIMRSVGAVRRQIIGMYVVNVLALSTLALLIGLPLGLLGAWGLAGLATNFLNFDLTQVNLPLDVLLLQISIGLLMPVGVAMYPIISGTRLSVHDAIYEYGLNNEERKGLIESLLIRLRNMSPPIMLSLRNTFRNKARLVFTLITLTLAGAMFVAAFSTRTSLTEQIVEIQRYVAFDASLSVPGGASRYTVEREALRVPGVSIAEGWSTSSGIVIHLDGSEGQEVEVVGLPFDTQTIEPRLLQGRWLEAGDARQVVINDDFLEQEAGVQVGSSVVLKVGGRERAFEVVGITSKHLSGPRVYMNYGAFGKLTGRQNQADVVRVRASADHIGSPAGQDSLAARLEQRFDDAGLSKSNSQTQHATYAIFTGAFDIILLVLIIMAGLLAVVGGLSLTGTMGMNVLERIREIGVLRAVGAANKSVRQVVVVEGVVVGMLSWLLSAILSDPTGRALAGAVVGAVMKTDLNYQYSFLGLLIWLAIVVFIGIVSSLGPARNASRLSVREVLDYE